MTPIVLPPLFLDALFAARPPGDVPFFTAPLAIDDAREAIGMHVVGFDYVVYFESVQAAAGDDAAFVAEMANHWAHGATPTPNARFVKFFRAEAASDSMFDPAAWPLMHRHDIWEFMRWLVSALAQHASAIADVDQYYFMPQTAKLDSMYVRMGKQFEAGLAEIRFRCTARPGQNTGGFICYERI